jgi:hypothetical protein
MPKSETGALVLKARANAVRTLIAKHTAQFDDLMAKECAALGVTYTPAPSPADVARNKIEALLKANPSLRSEYSTGLDEFRSPAA